MIALTNNGHQFLSAHITPLVITSGLMTLNMIPELMSLRFMSPTLTPDSFSSC